jgi:two-component system CheB/CheR fusion protein
MRTTQINSKILKDLSGEFYSQVIDSLQDYSIFTLDNDLIITSWSSGSVTIFGYETEEIIGKHFDIIFTEEDKIKDVPEYEVDRALNEGRAVDNRWHVRKDGKKINALGIMFPLIGDEGEFLGYVKILRDLTEKWNWEEERKRYVKDLEELIIHKESILSVLAHDLRSPLGGIISITDYLKSDFDKLDPPKIKEMIDILYKASKEELDMLDYLVKWARIKTTSEIFTPKKIGLAQSVKNAFSTLSEVAVKDSITLLSEVEENISVFADEKMLYSILQNLVSNGIKHSHKGGKVTVTARERDKNIIVQIQDTGSGMPKEVQEKLFSPQISSLSQLSEESKGASFGLLLVKGFLDMNGGDLWVESVEGKGSSFYFTLPMEKPVEKSAVTANKTEESANNIEFEKTE